MSSQSRRRALVAGVLAALALAACDASSPTASSGPELPAPTAPEHTPTAPEPVPAAPEPAPPTPAPAPTPAPSPVPEAAPTAPEPVAPGSETVATTPEPAAPAAPAAIAVTPRSVVVPAGGTVALVAVVRAADGATLAAPVRWSSAGTGLVRVTPTGVVVAGTQAGIAAVVASAGRVADTVRVEVTATAAVAVEVPHDTVAVAPGETTVIPVVLRDAHGNRVAPSAVAFASLTPQVAAVSQDGAVVALRSGTARVEVVARAPGARDALRTVVTVVVAAPPPVRDSVVLDVADFGTLRRVDGAPLLLAGIFLAGDGETPSPQPYQAVAEYHWGALPADATIERATATLSADADGVWGAPASLGTLLVERADAAGIRDGAPTESAASLPVALGAMSADVTALARESRRAGDAVLLLLVRFTQGTNRNGADDVLELRPGRVTIVYTRPAGVAPTTPDR